MKDYKAIWQKWYTLLNTNASQQTLDSLHIEVRTAFDIISQVGLEELQHHLNQQFFEQIKNTLKLSLTLCIWNGYALFLVENNLDPIKDNFIAKEETNELGNEWMENYNKDKFKNAIMEIDPVLSMFLEKAIQNEMNKLIAEQPTVLNSSYKEIGHIENFYTWSCHQGFILGMLENKLQKK